MEVFQVRVGQSFSYIYSFVWVESKQLLQQVNGLRMGEGKEFVEVLAIFLVLWQVFDELIAFFRNVLHVVNIRSSQILTNQLNLILSVSSWKKGLSLKHFSKNAANTPHIH